jgi:hypothetical protein
MLTEIECATGSRGLLLVTWFAFGLGKLEKSQVMKAMRLTLNEHHRKLRGVGDISDWLVSADVSGFCHPYRASEWLHRCTRPGRWLHFRIFHDFLLPPTTFCCLPRLSAASYDFLLPPTTTCCLPQLPRCDRLEKYLRHLAWAASTAW